MIRDLFDTVGGVLGGEKTPVVAVMRLKGVIGSVGPGRKGMTLRTLRNTSETCSRSSARVIFRASRRLKKSRLDEAP